MTDEQKYPSQQQSDAGQHEPSNVTADELRVTDVVADEFRVTGPQSDTGSQSYTGPQPDQGDERDSNVVADPQQTAELPDNEKPGTQFPHEQARLEADQKSREQDDEHADDTGDEAQAGHESDSEAAREIATQEPSPKVGPVPGDGQPGRSHLTLTGIPVQPVYTDGRNRRSDADALVGHFVDVVDGEFKGKFGAFERVLEHSLNTGYPTKALVRTRDAANELLVVPYEHLRTSVSHGGR